MISKLRRKFLFVTFIAIFVVVGVIVGYINLFNYTHTMNKHNNIIENIINNNTNFDNNSFENVISRYTIIIDISDDKIDIIQGEIDNDLLDDIITYITTNDNTSGKYELYAYGVEETPNGYFIVLSNFERDNQLIANYLYNSLIISLLGILCVYVILFFTSSFILKPFIINEENQKEFITNASHELKTPITIIKANLDVLKIDEIDNEWTRSISDEINRLELLTNNLIGLAKVEESREMIKTEFSLTDAIKEELSSYTTIFKERNIELNSSLNDNVSFNGNEKQLRDVFKLLLDNTIKYSTKKTNIYIENKELFFTNTTDLKDGNYDYIFNRFTRISSSRNQEISGYGIGLSIVKKIINNHNCDITAYVLNNIFYIKIKL